MNRLSRFISENRLLAWLVLFALILASALVTAVFTRDMANIAAVALLTLLFGAMVIKALQSRHQQSIAAAEVAQMSLLQRTQAAHKEQVAQAALLLQYATSVNELAHTFLREMHRIFGALRGVVYEVDPDNPNQLLCRATYACAEDPTSAIGLGEGLLGQCAADRRPMLVTSVPAGIGAVHSGLGSTSPQALLLAPVILKDELLGVVELALLKAPDASDHERLLGLTGLLAMNLQILGRSDAAQKTLREAIAAEHAKAEQLFFQHALIDAIPYPVFYKGADARFLGVNRAYEATFNVKREELIGKRVLDVPSLPEADRLSYQAEDEETIAKVGRVQRVTKIPFADGVHDTIYFAGAFRGANQEPAGLVGTFIDVSALKKDLMGAQMEIEGTEK